MQEQIDRRASWLPRIPVDLLVELSHEGDDDVYEAEAVDLGRGGIGLRSTLLPEVGQRLRCRFDVPGADEPVEAHGQVVWAHDQGRWRGAFGVRFEVLEPRAAAVLESIAPAPPEAAETPAERHAPRSVKVRLDGVADAIEGEIVDAGEVVTVEQPMPLLRIGRGASIEAAGPAVRAVLEGVRVRVADGMPRLVLQLGVLSRGVTQAGPEPTGERRSVDSEELGAPSDATLRDAPVHALLDPAHAENVRHLRDLEDRPERESPRVVRREEAAARAEASPQDEMRVAEGGRAAMGAFAARAAVAWTAARATLRAVAVLVRTGGGQVLARGRAVAARMWRALATWLSARWPGMAELLRHPPRRRITAPPPSQGPATGAAQRHARRAAPAESAVAPGRRSRALALIVAGCVAVGLTAYAWASGTDAPADMPREPGSWSATASSLPTPTGTGVVTTPITEPETVSPIVLPEGGGTPDPQPAAPFPQPAPGLVPVEAGHIATRSLNATFPQHAPGLVPVEAGEVATGMPQHAEARAMPEPPSEPGRIPPLGYPTLGALASNPTPRAAVAGPTARAMQFGAASVEHGRTATLRMSAPVQGLEGTADEHGFTVTVHGALSLDRAGPIAASHPAVERASILNRGDHCVLTIRFVDGRTPAYRVLARGTELDVTIGR